MLSSFSRSGEAGHDVTVTRADEDAQTQSLTLQAVKVHDDAIGPSQLTITTLRKEP